MNSYSIDTRKKYHSLFSNPVDLYFYKSIFLRTEQRQKIISIDVI